MELIINAVTVACGVRPDEVIFVGNDFFVCRLGEKFGLYDHQSKKLAIDFICSNINHFPNTTHLWVECDEKVGVFDTELRQMVIPVEFSTVCHTLVPGVFSAWKESKQYGIVVELRLDTASMRV